MSRKTISRMITAVGVIMLALFAMADLIGLGQSPDVIGYRQLLGVIAGALVIALGFYLGRGVRG